MRVDWAEIAQENKRDGQSGYHPRWLLVLGHGVGTTAAMAGAAALLLATLVAGRPAAALVSALSARVVLWRGISCRVDGPWKIRVSEDRPYQAGPSATDSNASLCEAVAGRRGLPVG